MKYATIMSSLKLLRVIKISKCKCEFEIAVNQNQSQKGGIELWCMFNKYWTDLEFEINSIDLKYIEHILEYTSFVSIDWLTLVNGDLGKIFLLDILLLGGFKGWTESDIEEDEISLDQADLMTQCD